MKTIMRTMAILVAALICFSCDGNSHQEDSALDDSVAEKAPKATWGDHLRRVDSLWAVYDNSTDEAEVEKAADMLYSVLISNAELGMLADKEYERYKAYVEEEFQQLLLAHPEYQNLFNQEKEKWERYHEAVLAAVRLEDYGSSGGFYVIGALEQSVNLWEASFHNLWLFEQRQTVPLSDTEFTSRMIDEAYSAYLKVKGDDWESMYSDNPKDGLKEFQDAIAQEKKLWEEWIAYRKKVCKSLPKEMGKVYKDCTNLTMRTKLYQLKNQNNGLGVFGNDVGCCMLPANCTDQELLDYPGFDVVWKEYLTQINATEK